MVLGWLLAAAFARGSRGLGAAQTDRQTVPPVKPAVKLLGPAALHQP